MSRSESVGEKTRETHTVTDASLLLTDVVDSTHLTETLGDLRMAEIWVSHDRMARDLLPLYDGKEIDKTDGMLLLFDDPRQAVEYAAAYHQNLRVLSEREQISFVARVGLHVASVQLRTNTDEDISRGAKPIEVDGLGKSLVARIMSLGLGGQTLISTNAMRSIHQSDLALKILSHGHFRLKGIYDPIEIFEVGLPLESPFVPPVDTPKAYRVVDVDGTWIPVAEVPQNLPAQTNEFFGRDPELRELADRLTRGQRLVTLHGPGGTGKSRLSLEFARRWCGDWPGGAWFCELEHVATADELVGAMANVAGIKLQGDDPTQWLGLMLAQRPPTLFVLDNFEQIVRHAHIVGQLVTLAPQTSWIVSSRERLHLQAEHVFRLDALKCPVDGDTIESILDSDAVQLFGIRASACTDRFELDEKSAPAVGELVRLLDGMPLAIELAAARVSVLSPQKMVARIGQRFKLLTSRRSGAMRRQDTLRGTIDWSWDLITPWERLALAQCSVFRGGFTLDAAEAVLDLDDWPEAPWPVDVIHSLVDKSLLRTIDVLDTKRVDLDEPLLGMYQSVRDYADEKLRSHDGVTDAQGKSLTGSAAQNTLRLRHAEYYGSDVDLRLEEAKTRAGLERLALESENLAAAFEAALAADAVDLAAACCAQLTTVAFRRGPIMSAIQRFDRLPLDRIDRRIRVRMIWMQIAMNKRRAVFRDDLTQLGVADNQVVGTPSELLEAKLQTALLRSLFDPKDALPKLRSLEPEFIALKDPSLSLIFARVLLITSTRGGEVDKTELLMDRLKREMETARACGLDVTSAIYTLCIYHLGMREFHETLALAEHILPKSDDADTSPYAQIYYHAAKSNALTGLDRWDEARGDLITGMSLAKKLGEIRFEWAPFAQTLARLHIRDGKLDEAKVMVETSIPILTNGADSASSAWAHSTRAEICLAEGHIEQARASMDYAYSLEPDIDKTCPWVAVWLQNTAKKVQLAEGT